MSEQRPIADIVTGTRVRQRVDQLDQLAESIRSVGLLHPVVIDQDGRLIAGMRRLAACRDVLGWTEIPVTVVDGLDEAMRLVAEGHENTCRVDFTPVEAETWQRKVRPLFEIEVKGREAERKRKTIEDQRRGTVGISHSPDKTSVDKSRDLSASATGYADRTLRKVREVREAALSGPAEVREVAEQALGKLDRPDAKVDREYNAVMRTKRQVEAQAAIKAAKTQPAEFPVHHCSLTDLTLEPDSVDLIFTDPPYDAGALPLWGDLAALAAKALKPGGFLVSYTGQRFLPEVIDYLQSERLEYWWTFAVTHVGSFFQMKALHIQVGWKPLMVYRQPGGVPYPPEWTKDIVTEGSREKSDHFDGGEWSQSLAEAAYWIDRLSAPGALIVDPFVGSGTTAVAARNLGRRFIGCDVDPTAVQSTRERLA